MMVFTWKDSLFIAGMTTVLIIAGSLPANAARPSDAAARGAPVAHGSTRLDAVQPVVPEKILVFFEPAKTELGAMAKEIVEKAAVGAQQRAHGNPGYGRVIEFE